jgi:catechol 2,3-dioxygenase-like lactoylglutathione lyase family enzyme
MSRLAPAPSFFYELSGVLDPVHHVLSSWYGISRFAKSMHDRRGSDAQHVGTAMAAVRYFVSDIERAVRFYTQHLGFKLDMQMGAAFASVSRDGIALWLSGPQSTVGRPLSDGSQPAPGGWNRFVIEMTGVAKRVAELQQAGVRVRGDIVGGALGNKALVEDPDGNLVELFEHE